MTDYRVDLDIYNGPLDLLLYLIRREEVEITDIPVVRIAEQYLAYLDLLQSLDINVAGEFLVMAATLMEIKSRMILPRPEMIADDGERPEDEGDPRMELIQQLLEYKRFKDAADDLGSLEDEQSRRYSRPPAQVVIGPEDQRYALDELLQGVQLWDLLNAFAKVMKSINLAPREVIYDDTPIEEVGRQIIGMIRQRKSMLFSEIFLDLFRDREQVSRTHLISAFLAILECIRQRIIGIEQAKDFEDLRVVWREGGEDSIVSIERLPVPPEALVTSREAARDSEQFRGFQGRMKHYDFDTDEITATEFDAELEAIVVPELAPQKPVYTDDELMGRPDAADTPATATGDTQAPAATDKPADAPPPPAQPPSEPPAAPADENPSPPPTPTI